jgi:uncharacterized SAM-binding protein YcdF (DUF218 family)
MFFLASKLLWLVLAPVNALLLLAFFSVAFIGRVSIARRTAIVAGFSLLLLAILPIGVALMRPLENRFPRPPADMAAPAGIIVLGGAIDGDISVARGVPTLGEGAGRVVEGVALSRRYPNARIVYSGGRASLVGTGPPEAVVAKALLVQLGVEPARIEIESGSRDTDENARFTYDLLAPKPGETWLLVTSAVHMPRAVGAFRRAGFAVIADPVDYRTTGDSEDWRLNREPVAGLGDFQAAIHEWLGLIAYRLSGRSDQWLPAP